MSRMRSLLPEAVDKLRRDTVAHAETAACSAGCARRRRSCRWGGMQIGADQGAFLALLVRSIGARRALEIGTFTGYSALAVARALPADGRLVCCDISEEWTQIGRRYWAEAGVADRIDLRLAPADETLRDAAARPGPGSFDFAFIDADKTGYDATTKRCLTLVRPGGLIAIDNMLWSGAVADPAQERRRHRGAARAQLKVRDDPRVDACLVTVGDGVMLALALTGRLAAATLHGSAGARQARP